MKRNNELNQNRTESINIQKITKLTITTKKMLVQLQEDGHNFLNRFCVFVSSNVRGMKNGCSDTYPKCQMD